MKKSSPYILILNAGSSTVKFSIFSKPDLKQAVGGIVERIGLKNSFFEYKEKGTNPVRIDYPKGVKNHTEAVQLILGEVEMLGLNIDMVGHRVVHGAEEFRKPTHLTPAVVKRIEQYSNLAPLHNPANIAVIRSCFKLLPGVKNMAHFDTAFHATLPPKAYRYSIPKKYYKKYRIRKYGFHGLSHQYVAEEAARRLKKPLSRCNMITCHLGSGCSIAAIKNGQSIDTTMGFTPLEGLTMATRSGDIDPAVVLFLIDKVGLTVSQVDNLLNKESGWKGLSGISSDLREILIAAGYRVPGFRVKHKFTPSQKKDAQLALEAFVYDVQRYIGSYISLLPRTDAIVFTAGVGERNQTVRGLIIRGIRKPKETKVLAIPTNEEYFIAQSADKLFGG